ncbi:MAG TPA: FAD-dependent oxidoreductase [Caulobacteraceae bacterium]|nr:FAD-dependent oxidoreductase [Caulobacteraceae bacterium]
MSQVVKNGGVSFWWSDIGGVPSRRPALDKDLQADVCIVGAGFTGLWTAYYLATLAPPLKIVVLDREFAGFGASGRNGGHMTGGEWSRRVYLKHASPDRLAAMHRALERTPAEIERLAAAEGIDADFADGGSLTVATTPAQLQRLRALVDARRSRLGPDADIALLSAEELRARIRVAGALGGVFSAYPGRVQPAKLVRGLAAAVERKGVTIYENTEVAEIRPKGVRATSGCTVTADVIVRATEGFTPQLAGAHLDLIPLNSAMLMTEPVPAEILAEIGWEGRELLNETSHLYSYWQRTREDRITVGGRGVPYRFGSRTDRNGATQARTIAQLLEMLRRLLPPLAGLRVDQAWCGVLGVSRDWCARVSFDRRAGLAWAGGYVGTGVSASNLAGRTLADLILGRKTELTTFPWVDLPLRRWEPEPVRWLGIHAMYSLYKLADRQELGGSHGSSRLADLANRITGRE